MVKAGGALIDNMALLFVIGVGVGMSDDHEGTAGLAAFASWLMITKLLSTGTVTVIMPSIAEKCKKYLLLIRLRTHLSVLSLVLLERLVTIVLKIQSSQIGFHFSVASGALRLFLV